MTLSQRRFFFKVATGVTIEHSNIKGRDSQWRVGASQRHDPVCQWRILRYWRVHLHGQGDGCAGDRLRRRGKKVRGFEYRLILDGNGIKDMPGSIPVLNPGSFKKNGSRMGHTKKTLLHFLK